MGFSEKRTGATSVSTGKCRVEKYSNKNVLIIRKKKYILARLAPTLSKRRTTKSQTRATVRREIEAEVEEEALLKTFELASKELDEGSEPQEALLSQVLRDELYLLDDSRA